MLPMMADGIGSHIERKVECESLDRGKHARDQAILIEARSSPAAAFGLAHPAHWGSGSAVKIRVPSPQHPYPDPRDGVEDCWG